MNENEENRSAVDEFLGNNNPENEEFNEVKDVFGDNIVETKEEEVVEKENKPLPFHKDPKVQRFIEKEIENRLAKVENKPISSEVKEEDDYYIRLIGNDTPEKVAMVREAKNREEKMVQSAVEQALSRVSQEKQMESEAERKAEEQLTNAIDDIENTFSVDLTSKDPIAKKNRVDFMNFIEKIAPKNAKGEIKEYPDMLSAYETFKEMRKSAPQTRAKDLASRSMGRSNDTVPKPQERVTFDNMDSFLDKIFKK